MPRTRAPGLPPAPPRDSRARARAEGARARGRAREPVRRARAMRLAPRAQREATPGQQAGWLPRRTAGCRLCEPRLPSIVISPMARLKRSTVALLVAALAASAALPAVASAQHGNGLYEPFPEAAVRERAKRFVERLPLPRPLRRSASATKSSRAASSWTRACLRPVPGPHPRGPGLATMAALLSLR